MKEFIQALKKNPAKFIYFSVLAIVLGLLSSVIYVIAEFVTEDTALPKNVVVSNITDQSVSISWITDKPVVGSVLVSKTDAWNVLNEFGKVRFWDDRDVRYDKIGKHYVHHVTIDGLRENTKYYYRISTGYRRYAFDAAGNKLPGMETGRVSESLYTPDPIYGKIFDNNGNSVSEEVLFYVQLRNVNGDWSTVLSGLANAEGGWTADRSNARNVDFNTFSSAGSGDIAILNAVGYSLTGVYLGEGKLEIPYGKDRPSDDLLLSEKIGVAMNFSESVSYSEKIVFGGRDFSLPNFSFVSKAFAQTCAPLGAYDRRCTGNQAGCALNAGEAEISRCDQVGNELQWVILRGECSLACDIPEEEGGPTIQRTERVADDCGCSCLGQDWVCRDKIKRFWSDGSEDSTCEAGTYIVGDAQCKPAAVAPAPAVPDNTCGGYAVNTWMCAGVGQKDDKNRYNCGQFKKSNDTCSWNAWKSGDTTSNPSGCANCKPIVDAPAAPPVQEDFSEEFRIAYERAKARVKEIKDKESKNEGIENFVNQAMSDIDIIAGGFRADMRKADVDDLISQLQSKVSEIFSTYNNYKQWEASCKTNCSFQAWLDQGKAGAQVALTVEEIDELINKIAWEEFEIRVSEYLKKIIRNIVLGISEVDEAAEVIREELKKNKKLGELPRISGVQVCENEDGCTCGPTEVKESDFNVDPGYNCLNRAKNGIQCDHDSQCISEFCGPSSKMCEVKPAETGTVNFDLKISKHPDITELSIPQLTFKMIKLPNGEMIEEDTKIFGIYDPYEWKKSVSNLEIGYEYTVSVTGTENNLLWSYSSTFKLEKAEMKIEDTVSVYTITSDEPVTLVINFDAFPAGITTIFVKPENLNIVLQDSNGVAKYRGTVSEEGGYRAQFNDISPGVYTVSANKEDCGNPSRPFRWNKQEQITVAPTGQDQSLIINVPIYACNEADIAAFTVWNEGCREDPKKSALEDCTFEDWIDAGKPAEYEIGAIEVGVAAGVSMKNENLLTKVGKLFRGVFSKAQAADVNKIEGSGVYQFTIEGLEVTTPPVQILTYGDETVEIKVFNDTNRNGIKDEGEDYLDVEALSIKIDKLSTVEVFRLNKGWNLLTFPITTYVDENENGFYDDREEGFATAKGLISEIINQGGYATTVSTYSAGQWNTYVERAGESKSNDFYIIPGDAYFIRVYTPITLSVSGNKFTDSVPVNLTSGWNLKGIISPSNYHTAESVIDSINASVEGAEADIVTQYIRGGYDNFIKTNGDVFGFDYEIEKKNGYFIRLKTGSGLWDPKSVKLTE